MRHFCDDGCEAVYRWSHRAHNNNKPSRTTVDKSKEAARQRVRRLVALANDAGASPPEADCAARIACRTIAKHHLLDSAGPAQFTLEDLMRWAQDHGVIWR